jgi:hypothetical protein
VNNSKLVNILRTFSKNEMKEFEKFILSPFFNRGRNYITFFGELKKFYPSFDNEKMTPEYIYTKMYPGKEFNKQIIWNMTSQMLNMAEDYLMHVSLKKNRFVKDYQVADEFSERKLAGYFYKKLDDMEAGLDKMGLESNYFNYKTQLEKARMGYHFMEDTQHLLSKHILKKGEYTILNFIKDITDVICDLDANYRMFNAKFNVNIPLVFIKNLKIEQIIKYANAHKFKYASVMEMYYQSMMMVLNFDDTHHFFRFRKLFEESYYEMSYGENLKWVTSLTNYCSNRINYGDRSFRKILFEIHKFELKEEIVFTNKTLSKILFIQILRNAIAINETNWVKKYIEDYVPKLKASYQKPMRALGFAYYYQRLGEHEKVLENLSRVKFIDVRDKLYVRFLYIRTYYDLNEHDALINQIDSARHFLNKNSALSDITKRNYMDFLAVLSRLIQAREKHNTAEIEILRKKLKMKKTLLFEDWLMKKLDELIKKGAA